MGSCDKEQSVQNCHVLPSHSGDRGGGAAVILLYPGNGVGASANTVTSTAHGAAAVELSFASAVATAFLFLGLILLLARTDLE